MKEVTINTQEQFDKLPNSFKEFTHIYIKDTKETVYVNSARKNSTVEAWGNSTVEAWENSTVEARGNSTVVAMGNSTVVARENSTVVARENSTVEARGNSTVVARENSTVEAWENSTVEAWENSSNYIYSIDVSITLFSFAVAFLIKKTKKIYKKSKTCTVIIPKVKKGLKGWFENNAVELTQKVIFYKKVSKDFKTQEGTKNETLWKIGIMVEVDNWSPKDNECGEGKFHACSRPYFCDEFRNNIGDKYIAIEINKNDLYVWPNPDYPHKIAFRKGKVMYECNKFGEKI